VGRKFDRPATSLFCTLLFMSTRWEIVVNTAAFELASSGLTQWFVLGFIWLSTPTWGSTFRSDPLRHIHIYQPTICMACLKTDQLRLPSALSDVLFAHKLQMESSIGPQSFSSHQSLFFVYNICDKFHFRWPLVGHFTSMLLLARSTVKYLLPRFAPPILLLAPIRSASLNLCLKLCSFTPFILSM